MFNAAFITFDHKISQTFSYLYYILWIQNMQRQIMRTHRRNNLYSIELYLVFCYLLSLFLCINFLRRGHFVSCENFCSVLLLIIKHPINFIDLLLLLSLTKNFTYFISRDIITFTPKIQLSNCGINRGILILYECL